MKAWNWIAMTLFGAATIGAAACSGDDPVETDDGQTTTTSTTTITTSTTTSTTTTTTTTATGGICDSGLFAGGGELFDGCLSSACCDTFNPCLGDPACAACLQDPTAAGCDANATFQAFETCSDTNCPNSVCGTDLAYGSPQLNACLNGSTCTEFNACEALPACNACLLDPMGSGCDANTDFLAYQAARDLNCPSSICSDTDGDGSGITYVITYQSNMATDTAYDTNKCATDNCCGTTADPWASPSLNACADPSMDGYPSDPQAADPERTACLDCLQMNASCPGGAVQTEATAFSTCITSNSCNN